MSLVEYRRKRRFDRTKEPEPGPALPAGQRAISPRRNMGVAMSRNLTTASGPRMVIRKRSLQRAICASSSLAPSSRGGLAPAAVGEGRTSASEPAGKTGEESVCTACSSGGRACRRALLAPAGQARRRAPEGRAVDSWDQMGWLSHWRVGRRTSEDHHASTIH